MGSLSKEGVFATRETLAGITLTTHQHPKTRTSVPRMVGRCEVYTSPPAGCKTMTMARRGSTHATAVAPHT
jgi:hypothetical protein